MNNKDKDANMSQPHDFTVFSHNDFIRTIAPVPKWSTSLIKDYVSESGRTLNRKTPINMQNLVRRQIITGATTDDVSCMTLYDIASKMTLPNYAWHLDWIDDDFMVLDIEPACPQNIKDSFLDLPYLYGEYSMSGKGIHLYMSPPSNTDQFPKAYGKTVLREEHGYYEILMADHWVTFTGNALVPDSNPEGKGSFEGLYAKLAQKATLVAERDVSISESKPEIPNEELILIGLRAVAYHKDIADFFGDHSKFEFSYLNTKRRTLDAIIRTSFATDHLYTDNERTWLLYMIAKEELPHREKHDRIDANGMTYLFNQAMACISKSPSPYTKQQQAKLKTMENKQ